MRELLRYAFTCAWIAAFVGILSLWGAFMAIVATTPDSAPFSMRAHHPLPRVGVFSNPWNRHEAGGPDFEEHEFFDVSIEHLLYSAGFEIVRIPSMTYYTNATNVESNEYDITHMDYKIDALCITIGTNVIRQSRIFNLTYERALAGGIPILALDAGAISLARLRCADCLTTNIDIHNYTTHAQKARGFFRDTSVALEADILHFDATEAVSVDSADLVSLVDCVDRRQRPYVCAFHVLAAPHIVGIAFQLDKRFNLASVDLASFVTNHFANEVIKRTRSR